MTHVTLKLKHMTINIDIPEDTQADETAVKASGAGHPLMYLTKPKTHTHTQNYLNGVRTVLEGLPKGMKVVELCAGIGLVAAMNIDLEPSSWIGHEIDAGCESIFKSVAPHATFVASDMYDYQPTSDTELMICDFGNNTLPKLWREPKRAALMKRIADSNPAYWHITDVGYYWIHLANHWPIYHARFGVNPTRENYAELFDRYARETWGYKVVKTSIGGGAQYILMQPV